MIDYFDEETLDIIKAKDYGYLTYKEKSHSAVITYEYFQTEDVKWYANYQAWNKLSSIGMVRKTTFKNNKKSVEKRYYISSLNTNIMLFSDSIRTHWQVGNKLHWQLDFTFKCDVNTTSNKNALFNLQLVKKLSLALLIKAKLNYKCSMKIIRYKLSLNFESELINLLSTISKC